MVRIYLNANVALAPELQFPRVTSPITKLERLHKNMIVRRRYLWYHTLRFHFVFPMHALFLQSYFWFFMRRLILGRDKVSLFGPTRLGQTLTWVTYCTGVSVFQFCSDGVAVWFCFDRQLGVVEALCWFLNKENVCIKEAVLTSKLGRR